MLFDSQKAWQFLTDDYSGHLDKHLKRLLLPNEWSEKLENRKWPKNWGKKNQKGPKILPCAWFFVKTFSDRFDIIISSPYSRKARESRQIFLMHRNQLLPIFRVFSSIHFLDCHSQIKWWAYPSCFHQVWNVKETSNLFINNLEIVFLELSQIAE